MAFDCTNAMKSLSRKIRDSVAPNATSIHCFAHCNYLIVKDAIKQCPLLSTSLDLCQALYAVVGAYPKRILLFGEIDIVAIKRRGGGGYCVCANWKSRTNIKCRLILYIASIAQSRYLKAF